MPSTSWPRCCATATPPRRLPAAPLVLVMPRLGTVSPWASKATDIARNCGLALHRIERVTEYRLPEARLLGGQAADDADELQACAALLHDRMTESVAFERDAARHLFDAARTAAAAGARRRAGRGRAALVAGQPRLRPGAVDDEIDYLVDAFRRCSATPATSS
jgi:phosphoribosylformylglycinamidine synthase